MKIKKIITIGFIQDFAKIASHASEKWHKNVEKCELAIKGGNYGKAEFEGYFQFCPI